LSGAYCIDAEIFSQNPLFEIDTIIFENTVYDDSVLALHGSAVEYTGKAYLFPAGTGSGKTTLASYLTSSGFGYITDDCILIDRNTFEVYPYNCPIQLRDGGLEVLEKLDKAPSELQLLDNPVMQRYIYIPQNCVTQPTPLGGIYFIERSETENMIADISTNEKMTELMKAPITNYEITPEYLRLLARLTQTVCRKLIYKDMEFVAEAIRKASEQYG
jgi:serine kinase of HPr protein (carbohydrate metabolism regulator)